MVYTYPIYLQPPCNLTVSEINIYGFTLHWNSTLQDNAYGNEYYHYIFLKPLHNYMNKTIKLNAGQLVTSFHIDYLLPDTWYIVYIQCIDTTYHISSFKSEEILVHTYSENIKRDSINQLTNVAAQIPPNQQITHFKRETMIAMNLPLSQLNHFIPTVYIVSLVIKPTKYDLDDEIHCSEGCIRKMHYNDLTDIHLIESTYNNRHNNENSSWEILVQSRLKLTNTRFRRSMDFQITENNLYFDKYFIIGENDMCLYNSHKCNGPLKPATQYRTYLPNLCTSVDWPTPVTVDEFLSYYKKYSEDSFNALKQQYQLIVSNNQNLILSDMLSQDIGQKSANRRLNRFSNILPYDQTRVKLNPLEKGKQGHDYVNASFIYEIIPCSSVKSHPLLNRTKIDYIASQAPLESTVGDFWRMILDQNITIVVMLTKLYEDDRSRCYHYWPHNIHESLTFRSDCLRIKVTLLSEEDHHMYILRKLYITASNNPKSSKYILQLHMTTWPDFGVPKMNEFQTFIRDYRELKCNEIHRYTPTLVHCTAGVGRTGTFIVADLLQNYKESNCIYYDIPGVILQMRRCRPLMVQKVVSKFLS
ncbi:Receptor-type tyrosine-protein phosphatase beta [Schistosoma japonicum]|nr:Receptor-type tyrosine-protein phosphatase beta [Schistosoma japonicum]